jgi:hypothetical protein
MKKNDNKFSTLRKAKKWSEKGAKREAEERKGTNMHPKGSQTDAKGNKMEPKAIQMKLKACKREPKGDQSASKSRLGRQGRFWEPKRVTA